MRTRSIIVIALFCFPLWLLSCNDRAKTLEGSRPNIILVITDDQGMGDLSCMGNEILKIPNLDSFFEISTRFTDFHVSPTCAPTRSAIMSGRAPFKNGVTHTIQNRERMDRRLGSIMIILAMPEMCQIHFHDPLLN